MNNDYDVAIVGGGPAGSNAARFINKFRPDLDVVLFERNAEPTANCAGGIAVSVKHYLGIQPPAHVINNKIKKAVIKSPNEKFELTTDNFDFSDVPWLDTDIDFLGWVVDRQAWDNYQLDLAEDQGTEVKTKHTVVDVEQNKDSVIIKVKNRREASTERFNIDNLGLACGPNYELAKQAGFDDSTFDPDDSELLIGTQYHMEDEQYFSDYSSETIFMDFNTEKVPEGYTWSFPESDTVTRWGNAIPLGGDCNGKKLLDEYLNGNNRQCREQSINRKTNALIPAHRPPNSCVCNNVALIGDVGYHCDPFHGGGMILGSRAGKDFAKAIEAGNISEYDKYWKNDILKTLNNRFILKNVIYSLDNDELDELVKTVNGIEVSSTDPDDFVVKLIWRLMKNNRELLVNSTSSVTKSLVRKRVSSLQATIGLD